MMIMKTALSLPLFALVLISGCATQSAQVTFTRDQTNKSVYQSFPGAYISSNRDGEYDIILVNDTLRAARQQRAKKPLQPMAQPPLQHAIHIHVFWRPVGGAMAKESSITNAIVDWYVFSPEFAHRTDMLHYQGAAFVQLHPKGDTAQITIGDGQIAAHENRGDLKDPIGPSRITGYIVAVKNDARVRDLIGRLTEKASGDQHPSTEATTDETPALLD
jgi:hypothetical protein